MKRILQYVPSYNYGGIESFTYELNKHLKDECQFVYLVEKDVDKKTKEKLSSFGAEVIRIPNLTKESFWGHVLSIRKLFKKEKFDAVHVHDCNNRFLVMIMAKLHGVKVRIYHVHSKNIGGGMISEMIKKMGIRLNVWFSTICLVCSKDAATVKKISKYKIVNNCIDAKEYRYDEEKGNSVRKILSLKREDIVLLFIGRIEKVKNVDFLLKVLKSLPNKEKQRFALIIIGDGSEMSRIRKLAKEVEGHRIIFVGRTENVADYYSASNYFCLPSFAEGFPITLLEAQANGLSCLVSVNVPNVVNLNKRVRFLKIDNNNIKEWVDVLLKKNKVSKEERLEGSKLIEELGYDSLSTAKEMSKIYGVLE